jgi:ABC-type sugar transport system permease subunit
VLEPVLSRGPTAEKQQLLFLGIGLTLIGGVNWWLFGPRVMSVALLVLGAVALAGRLAHRVIGRGVFLVFALLAMAVGRVVSWVILLLMYVLFIAGLGSVLRLFGMDRLARNFAACKKRGSMLMDVPPVDAASFERQS